MRVPLHLHPALPIMPVDCSSYIRPTFNHKQSYLNSSCSAGYLILLNMTIPVPCYRKGLSCGKYESEKGTKHYIFMKHLSLHSWESLLAELDPSRYASTWFSNLHDFYAVKIRPKGKQHVVNILLIRNPGLLQIWGGEHGRLS